ncbi:hypothetical protein BC936DRAFT_137316 [Jimgerdemannia flammicorona]|uniref:Uncharacterized protein n=1 Tax=Jimgerdemannia flammicorona TaxID=994334 RepID=A0A433CXN6_9FUNG|nr:hypothetical protein BC936DRAFT_137316 [Jimgerdemannia flammicorona]
MVKYNRYNLLFLRLLIACAFSSLDAKIIIIRQSTESTPQLPRRLKVLDVWFAHRRSPVSYHYQILKVPVGFQRIYFYLVCQIHLQKLAPSQPATKEFRLHPIHAEFVDYLLNRDDHHYFSSTTSSSTTPSIISRFQSVYLSELIFDISSSSISDYNFKPFSASSPVSLTYYGNELFPINTYLSSALSRHLESIEQPPHA